MKMPGFEADASLYRTSRLYRGMSSFSFAGSVAIHPALAIGGGGLMAKCSSDDGDNCSCGAGKCCISAPHGCGCGACPGGGGGPTTGGVLV
jgi:hypothetical protein